MRIRNTSSFASDREGFRPYRFGTFWLRAFDSTEDIRFFPELRYLGWLVTPQAWHETAVEPLLLCRMGVEEISTAGGLPETMAARRELEADGWDWSRREEGLKFVHVDDLEKIEGPPPEGAF